MYKKYFSYLIILTTFIIGLAAPNQAISADCTTPYGGYGETCVPTQISVNKQVRNPITGVFVENLLSGDAAYSPGSEVTYKLTIYNNDTVSFGEVFVKDTLPEQLKDGRVSDDNKDQVTDQNYNASTRELTFKIHDLKAGEGREIKVVAIVKDASNFDKNQSIFCNIENKARVEAEGQSNEDTAKLCVQTEVLGTTTLPQAGPEDYLPLLPFLTMGITGIALFIKKK